MVNYWLRMTTEENCASDFDTLCQLLKRNTKLLKKGRVCFGGRTDQLSLQRPLN